MKKEMEKKIDNIQQSRKLILDSMELRLSGLYRRIQGIKDIKQQKEESLDFEQDRQDYLKRQKTETQETIEFIEQNLPTENLRASIRARQRELQNR